MIDQTPAISPDPYLEEVLMAGRGEDGSETEANEQVEDKRDEEVAEGVDPKGQDAHEEKGWPHTSRHQDCTRSNRLSI